ncbi:MAG: glycosyltransferase [Longimicrobiales bacterium]
MKIVHLGKYYPPALGGIEAHTQTLARSQAALGADVRVVVANHATADGRDVAFRPFSPTLDTWDTDGPVKVYRAGRSCNLARLDLTPGLPSILNQLRREAPDVWHLHTPNVTMMLAVLADRRLRPLVVSHHSDIVRQLLLRHLVRPLEAAIYRRAVRLLPASALYIEGSELLQRFRHKTEPLPYGIDASPFQQPSPEATAYAVRMRSCYGEPIWLCVGRLVYYKALNVALQALTHLPGKLLIIGTGPMAKKWQRLATELGISERVIWHGQASQDELVGAYHAATALWFPSNVRSEGFGLVQVEALASGCPVINAAVPHSGVPWVSRHEETGLTVAPNDVGAFVVAARRLLEEPGLRTRLSQEATRQATARFDHRIMAERCLAIYHALAR